MALEETSGVSRLPHVRWECEIVGLHSCYMGDDSAYVAYVPAEAPEQKQAIDKTLADVVDGKIEMYFDNP